MNFKIYSVYATIGCILSIVLNYCFGLGIYSILVSAVSLFTIHLLSKNPKLFNMSAEDIHMVGNEVDREVVNDDSNDGLDPTNRFFDNIIRDGMDKLTATYTIILAFQELTLKQFEKKDRAAIQHANAKMKIKIENILNSAEELIKLHTTGELDLLHTDLRKFFTVYIDILHDCMQSYSKVLNSKVYSDSMEEFPGRMMAMLNNMEDVMLKSANQYVNNTMSKVDMATDKMKQMSNKN